MTFCARLLLKGGLDAHLGSVLMYPQTSEGSSGPLECSQGIVCSGDLAFWHIYFRSWRRLLFVQFDKVDEFGARDLLTH